MHPLGFAARERGVRRWLRSHGRTVALIITCVLVLQLHSWWSPTHDATGYLSIARSVFSGHGLTYLSSPQLYYQIGYPLLISPLFLLQEHPFFLLSAAHVLMAGIAIVLVYRWARPLVDHLPALLIASLVLANASFLYYTRTTLSEVPAIVWMIAAGISLRELLRTKSPQSTIAWTLISAALVLFATTTRYATFAVVPGFFLGGLFAWREKQISLLKLLLCCVCVGLPALATVYALIVRDAALAHTAAGHGLTYTEQMRSSDMSLLQQITESIRLRISEIGRLLLPGMIDAYSRAGAWLTVNVLLYIGVTSLVLLGWWRAVRHTRDVLVCSLPFYAGVYLIWPYDAGVRFFTPLLPVLWMSVWFVLANQRNLRLSLLALIAGLHLGTSLVFQFTKFGDDGPLFAKYFPACQSIAKIADGRTLAVRNVPNSVWMWLNYLTDRPVLRLYAENEIPSNINRLVQPAGSDAPAGYQVSCTFGELELVNDSGESREKGSGNATQR